jgi:acyl-CoA carboxylase subunit beta
VPAYSGSVPSLGYEPRPLVLDRAPWLGEMITGRSCPYPARAEASRTGRAAKEGTMGERRSAIEVIDAVADTGSFEPWDDDVVSDDPLGFVDRRPYPERLAEAAEAAGTSESVVTGRVRLGGRDLVVIAGEFAFLAGTMGVATARRVVRAFDRAREEGWPVVGLPISGGTRMQEGTVGFVQMASIAAAVRAYRRAGGCYITYLRNPTTGGVLASWGSLGHLTLAAPEALIGLTGPRVIEQLTGRPFPRHVQTAEHLRDHGVVDDVVPLSDLRERLARILTALEPPEPWTATLPPLALPDDAQVDAWAAVERSRRTDRPGIRELLDVCATAVTPLRGDGAGGDDPGCLAVLARLCGVGAIVVGHDRLPGERGAQLGAAGYRKARRAMRLAEELGLPLVTVVDTAGARMTPGDEEQGLAAGIAECLGTLADVRIPTLSLLLGEGSGGGALAFLPADRVVAAEHSWLAPIAPEGASTILHRTTERAQELARAQSTSSTDLRRLGIVDVVVPDRPAPGEQGGHFAARVAATAAQELRQLVARPADERLAARRRRYHPDSGIGAPCG